MSDYPDFDELSEIVGADDARRLLRHSYWTGHEKRPVLDRDRAEDLLAELGVWTGWPAEGQP